MFLSILNVFFLSLAYDEGYWFFGANVGQ
jgi:hypothetical protein